MYLCEIIENLLRLIIMAKNNKNQDYELENVENALSTSEAFIEKYKKEISYVLGGIILIAVIILAFKSWYIAPREAEAQEKIAICQEVFAKDSFQLALNGDGEDIIGFEAIAKDYKFTKTAKLASLYAGICYFQMSDYENAVKFLDKFNLSSVNVSPATIGLIGDCYVEMKEYEKAAKFFKKASKEDNELTAPFYLKKLGVVYEELGKYDEAIEAYTTIKDQYFKSLQAADIDKYIERANLKK